MPFDPQTLMALAAVAERAARAAGQYILSVDREQLTVAKKSGAHSLAAQLFTEVDCTSEAIIHEYLLPTMASGHIAWLAEESADNIQVNQHERFHKQAFWCVDPLDGTQDYLQGGSGFAVAIALVSQAGLPLLSVVYHPPSNTCYHARLGESLQVPMPTTNTTFTLFADRSFLLHRQYEQIRRAIEHLVNTLGASNFVVVTNKGAVMNACSVLRTSNSAYFKLPKAETGGGCIWDFASTVGLFNAAAGKKVSDLNGEPLQLNPKDTLYFNHCGVLFSSNHKVHAAMLQWWCKFNLTSTLN